jgi:hypothetical protein
MKQSNDDKPGNPEVILRISGNRDYCRRKAAFKRTFEPANLRRLIIPVSISPCF